MPDQEEDGAEAQGDGDPGTEDVKYSPFEDAVIPHKLVGIFTPYLWVGQGIRFDW